MSSKREKFWELPLDQLNDEEWEALCDGCGLCCVNKIEDEDTGLLYLTNVACNLLDLNTMQCSDYCNRQKSVPECVKLRYEDLKGIHWLPKTCAYLRRYRNLPLPAWHYLRSGDPEKVHQRNISLRGELIHEADTKDALERYIIERM